MKLYSYKLLRNGDVELINPKGNTRTLTAGMNENDMFDIELDRAFRWQDIPEDGDPDAYIGRDISATVIDFYWHDRPTAWRTGYTDGFHGDNYNNTYTVGSQSWIDYDIGFEEGEDDNV